MLATIAVLYGWWSFVLLADAPPSPALQAGFQNAVDGTIATDASLSSLHPQRQQQHPPPMVRGGGISSPSQPPSQHAPGGLRPTDGGGTAAHGSGNSMSSTRASASGVVMKPRDWAPTAGSAAVRLPPYVDGWTTGLSSLCLRLWQNRPISLLSFMSVTGSSTTCSPSSLLSRLRTLHARAVPSVSMGNATEMTQYLCPPLPHPFAPHRDEPVASSTHKRLPVSLAATGRVALWGGVDVDRVSEAMMQLWAALAAMGLDAVYAGTAYGNPRLLADPRPPAAELVAMYSSPPLLASESELSAGDTLFVRPDLITDCRVFRELRQRGVRVVVWLLELAEEVRRSSIIVHCIVWDRVEVE